VRSRGFSNSRVSKIEPQSNVEKIRKAIQLKASKQPVVVVKQKQSQAPSGSSRNNPSIPKSSNTLHVKNNKTLEINKSWLKSAAH